MVWTAPHHLHHFSFDQEHGKLSIFRSCSFSFMYGEQTDKETIKKIQTSLDQHNVEQVEIRLLKKSSQFILPLILSHIATRLNAMRLLCCFEQSKNGNG